MWPGLVVEENNLQVQVSALRKALGPGAIATLPGRSYRLTVDCASNDGAPTTPSSATPPVEDIIGRNDELAALRACMVTHRIVTVVGAGGIGKTAVARALVRSSVTSAAGALAWVDLAALPAGADAAAVASTVAAAVGAPLSVGDAPVLLARALAGSPMLLVLDNAEHVAQAVATVTVALVEGTTALRLLVTSQVALHVAGEQVWRLDVLALPPTDASLESARAHGAFALFERRARESDHRFTLGTADVQRAIALCHALDDNALAIELAAARAPQLGMGPLLQLGRLE